MTTALLQVLDVLWVCLQILFLWMVADFITGMVHWWMDAYGDPNMPILGKSVIVPNLYHHHTPRAMLNGSYWNKISTSVYGMVVIATIVWICGWHSWRMLVCLALSTQANEIHAMAHRSNKENGVFVCMLQKIGIFQRRKTHGWHHKAPYDTNFCILTEYVNPVLIKIHFFERLEWVLLEVFRIKVLRGSSARDGV